MQTPYREVSFADHDVITRDTMDQLQQNLQWIKDNTPRGQIYLDTTVGPSLKNDLLIIVAGRVKLNSNSTGQSSQATVNFGPGFDSSCNPYVTTAVCADQQRKLFCVVTGLSGKDLPDSTGFLVKCAAWNDPSTKQEETVKADFWVHWMAMGFRTDDMSEF